MIRMTWPMYRRGECEVFGRVVSLSPNEATILSTLLMRRGRTVTIDQLVEELWPNPDQQPDYAYGSIWRYIEMLRKMLGKDVILLVNKRLARNVGYMIAA